MPIRSGLVAFFTLTPLAAAAGNASTAAGPIRYVDVPPLSTEPMRARQGQPWVVWLNFDGGRPNSFIYSGNVGPFDSSKELRAAVVQSARRRWEAYGIRVTGVEPTSGDYDTEFVGPWLDQDPGGAAGVAPAGDCWNNRGGETSFTMLSGGTADGVAEVLALLDGAGIAHSDPAERYGATGNGQSIYAFDPDGRTVELKLTAPARRERSRAG